MAVKRDKRTDIKREFIESLRETYSVYHSCKKVGVGRTTVYAWREEDKEFEEAWDSSLADAVDKLETSMYQRALDLSYPQATTAAIFLLKGAKPEKYHERYQVNTGGLTDDELEERISNYIRKVGVAAFTRGEGAAADSSGNGSSSAQAS